jgi:hypothetical protein
MDEAAPLVPYHTNGIRYPYGRIIAIFHPVFRITT